MRNEWKEAGGDRLLKKNNTNLANLSMMIIVGLNIQLGMNGKERVLRVY